MFQSMYNAQLSIFMLNYGNFFQYERIFHSYLYDLGENKSVYVFPAEMSGFSSENVRDPRSQDPAF